MRCGDDDDEVSLLRFNWTQLNPEPWTNSAEPTRCVAAAFFIQNIREISNLNVEKILVRLKLKPNHSNRTHILRNYDCCTHISHKRCIESHVKLKEVQLLENIPVSKFNLAWIWPISTANMWPRLACDCPECVGPHLFSQSWTNTV